MLLGNVKNLVFLFACVPALVSCDQINGSFSNRYEISKDQNGRTLRLDKRTGELAVVDGDRLLKIMDSVQADAAKKQDANSLAMAKPYPAITLNQFGLQATLRTSWQDGNLLYSVSLRPTERKSDEQGKVAEKTIPPNESSTRESVPDTNTDWDKAQAHIFTLLLEDVPFELARDQMVFSGVVDDTNKKVGMDAKGKIAMSTEAYKRIDSWNVLWRRRY